MQERFTTPRIEQDYEKLKYFALKQIVDPSVREVFLALAAENKQLKEERKKLEEDRVYLEAIANIDPLTGLNNRRLLGRVRDYSAVLMCDVDDFKQVNDQYGHDVGDTVLQAFARILKRFTRSTDYICRYGGDEFTIVFVDCPKEIIVERCEQIAAETIKYIKVPNPEHKITTSIGVAMRTDKEEKLEHTLKNADTALYKSKLNGKNQITIHEGQLTLKK